MQDTVTVALKARPKVIGLFLAVALSGALRASGTGGKEGVKALFTLIASDSGGAVFARQTNTSRRVLMGHGDVGSVTVVALHRGGPAPRSFGYVIVSHAVSMPNSHNMRVLDKGAPWTFVLASCNR